MKLILQSPEQVKQVVSRMMFLAYNAAGHASGMGVFKERETVTEQEVYDNAYNKGDYFGRYPSDPENEIYGDYVFGRMIKWGCHWENNTIVLYNQKYRPDYQGFSRIYKSDKALAKAALKELKIENYIFED